jgi:peptide/nickel transport system ATP-binding protein
MSDDIVIRNLEVRFETPFGEAAALNQLDLTLAAGSVTGLIGESGSGKSVLGMSILRLLPANALVSGSIFFRGRDLLRVSAEDMRALRGKVLGLIPQNPSDSINPVLKIRPQIREIFQAHEQISGSRGNEKTRRITGRFFKGEEDKVLGGFSFQLSGGMRQRVVTIWIAPVAHRRRADQGNGRDPPGAGIPAACPDYRIRGTEYAGDKP